MPEALAVVADNRKGRGRHSGSGNTVCLAHDGRIHSAWLLLFGKVIESTRLIYRFCRRRS